MALAPIEWIREKLNPVQPTIHQRETSASSDYHTIDYKAAYDQIEVVRRAIDMIINACVEVSFDITGSSAPLMKLSKLLNERPNPFEDRVKFFRRVYFDLLIDGNAFLYYDGSHLHILPASDVTIHSDPKTFIAGYSYSSGSWYADKKKGIDFSPSEVIHIKLDNDESIFRGKSPLKSLGSIINIYNALLKFQKQFFKNNAVPGIVLTTDSVLNTKVKERILQVWRSNYSTFFDGAKSPAILDGGLKIDTFSNVDFQSLDFESSVERLEQDMAKALGVPYVLMKSGNNANIGNNQVLFYEQTVLPLVQMVASALTHFFNSATIKPDRAVITALQPDLKVQSQYYVSLVNSGIIKPNEARIKLGFEAMDDPEMDKIRVPQNITGSATNPMDGGRPPES